MWKTINKLTNKTSKITNISEINQNGNRVTDDATIANTLNEHLNEMGPKLASDYYHKVQDPLSHTYCPASHDFKSKMLLYIRFSNPFQN